MLIGYARISMDDQHLYMQEDALKSAGCDHRARLYTQKLGEDTQNINQDP